MALVLTEGEVYAIDDAPADVSLSEGDVEGCFIECWLHGSQFDLRTGERPPVYQLNPSRYSPLRSTAPGPMPACS